MYHNILIIIKNYSAGVCCEGAIITLKKKNDRFRLHVVVLAIKFKFQASLFVSMKTREINSNAKQASKVHARLLDIINQQLEAFTLDHNRSHLLFIQ